MAERLDQIADAVKTLEQSTRNGFRSVDERFDRFERTFASKADLETLREEVRTTASKADLETLREEVRTTASKADLETLRGEVRTMASKADLETLRGEFRTMASKVDLENIRDEMRKAAEGYGATLERIERGISEMRFGTHQTLEDHARVLKNHGERITALERKR
jgi:Tfp pilus assembly protein PilO